MTQSQAKKKIFPPRKKKRVFLRLFRRPVFTRKTFEIGLFHNKEEVSRNMLKSKGLSIGTCGTPHKIFSHEL